MDKRFWGILIGIVVVLGVVFWIAGGNKANAPSSSSQVTNHIEGEGKDGITLLEYGDYECPFCGQFFPIVKQVQAEYNTQLFFQFRNLPLVSLHPNAFAGARAAEAAALQGKFWEMHDTLYENQDPNGQSGWVASSDPLDDYFVTFAQQIGLNVTTFKQAYASDAVNNAINADTAEFAKDYKAATGSYNPNTDEATPTFFLDGTKLNVAESASSFESLINAEIKKKGFTPPSTSSTSTPNSSATTPQSVQ